MTSDGLAIGPVCMSKTEHKAYHLSDFYIQKLKYKDSIINIQKIVNNSIMDFTDRVAKISQKKRSSYVEACKAYINDHYRNKIRIGEISTYCGFPSQSYYADMFHKYTGLAPGEYRRRYKPAEF